VANPSAAEHFRPFVKSGGEIGPAIRLEPGRDGSAIASPLSRPTPSAAEAEEDDLEEEDEADGPFDDMEEEALETVVPMTAAERRAEKRKMKRFRSGCP
jgi:hypothetical protein